MIVEFCVGNYMSIKDAVTLSMVASNPVKELEDLSEGQSNVFYDRDQKVKYLKSAVIYGANGSGKSNLIRALGFFRRFILSSSNDRQAEEEIDLVPFLLSLEQEPSSFEMVFEMEDVRYRYGFQANLEIVTSEWLFGIDLSNSTKEKTYFTRNLQEIKIFQKNFAEGKGIEANTRSNALFLSTVAQLNGERAIKIQNWFRNNLNLISGLDDNEMGLTIKKFVSDPTFRKLIIKLMHLFISEIEHITIESRDHLSPILEHLTDQASPEQRGKVYNLLRELHQEMHRPDQLAIDPLDVKINATHFVFDDNGKTVGTVAFSWLMWSQGTQKVFSLLGPWLEALLNGEVLIVDEFDARLHTKLSFELVRLFQSELNTKNAQLIFVSHDTNLLRADLFRRDQIWFTEKNKVGATDLYSLVEYKVNQATSVRNDASFEKDYLLGKYGAIPYFGDIKKFLSEFANGEE